MGMIQSRPEEVPSIHDTIEASKWILAIGDDFDGAGSPGYHEDTWRRATDFLARYASRLKLLFGKAIPEPKIGPGPAGSIDLHWKREEGELLVSFPCNPASLVSFYGDDYEEQQYEGTVESGAWSPVLIGILAELS